MKWEFRIGAACTEIMTGKIISFISISFSLSDKSPHQTAMNEPTRWSSQTLLMAHLWVKLLSSSGLNARSGNALSSARRAGSLGGHEPRFSWFEGFIKREDIVFLHRQEAVPCCDVLILICFQGSV